MARPAMQLAPMRAARCEADVLPLAPCVEPLPPFPAPLVVVVAVVVVAAAVVVVVVVVVVGVAKPLS